MVSAFTPNIQLEEQSRGDQVGTWDTPVNNNMTLVDKVVGAITTIGLNNSNVVLSSPQYQSKTIIFNSTLTGSVSITFPSTFTKSYEIQNLCTGSSAFTITLQTTVAGGQAIGVKPGEFFDVVSDGTNLKFKNMGHIGTYWDYAGSSVPNWVSLCTVPPYLNCDGTTFNSSVYPVLFTVLGSTILPDRRGTTGYTLNQSTGRLTTALGGLDGNTVRSIKTTQVTIGTSNLPAYTPTGSVASTVTNNSNGWALTDGTVNVTGGGASSLRVNAQGTPTISSSFTGTAQGGASNVLPVGSATITGIIMIRAA